jgi:hypothetical protein
LKELQELVASANAELAALDKIVSMLDDSHTIDPVTLKETEDGYEVSFKDGKKIFIPFGKDGSDGRTLIPVGVKLDEDGLYYWTVDGEWLLDAEGNKMRAGATDGQPGVDGESGVDGIVPQIKVEDDWWWISVDGGETFEKLASCDEMNGVGVFSGIDTTDPSKLVLTLLDGTALEIPRESNVKVSFVGAVMDTVLIGAGELLPIPYEITVEGADAASVIVTSGTDGTYFSRIVEGETPGKGTVLVQAPDVFSKGYILLNAFCDGYSAVKMISFEERKVIPAADTVTVRLKSGSDTVNVAYSANFEYTVSCDSTWLKVVPDSLGTTLTFIAEPNASDTVRTCLVNVSPKNNPGYVCTTFLVLQATDAASIDFDPAESEGFSYDPETQTLSAPAAGGNAIIRLTSPLGVEVANVPNWLTASVSEDGGFYKLGVTVTANESEDFRKDAIVLMFGKNVVRIKVNQAGKAPADPENPGASGE